MGVETVDETAAGGRPRPAPTVRPPIPAPLDARPFLPLAVCATTHSSLGMSATLVRNIFSKVCAITTTSSPGLLYT